MINKKSFFLALGLVVVPLLVLWLLNLGKQNFNSLPFVGERIPPDGITIKDTIYYTIPPYSFVDQNGNVIPGQNEIFKDAVTNGSGVYTDTYFDYENSTVYFSLENADVEQLSAPYSFPREAFINDFFENSISDNWAQYDDGVEAILPIDGFGKKFNFVSKNFIEYPSPNPVIVDNDDPDITILLFPPPMVELLPIFVLLYPPLKVE